MEATVMCGACKGMRSNLATMGVVILTCTGCGRQVTGNGSVQVAVREIQLAPNGAPPRTDSAPIHSDQPPLFEKGIEG